MLNLFEVLRQRAASQPKHPAIVGPAAESTLSYAELCAEVETMAGQLRGAGLRAGDAVALHYPSGRDYIILTYALWRAGACVVPIAIELAADEKEQLCRQIHLAAVVTPQKSAAVFEPVRAGDATPLRPGMLWLPVRTFRAQPEAFASLNPAFLRFTSGTTGSSKGVVLSHQTIHERICAANDVLHIGPEDRVIWLLSMSYHFAVSIVSYLSFGATIVLAKNHFGATLVTTTIEHAGTLIYGSPLHYELMASEPSGRMLPSLRLAVSTTTKLPAVTAQTFHQRFGLPLTEAYGIIEIGLPCINVAGQLAHAGSVGRVLPAYDVQLRDIGLPDGVREIWLRGPGMLDAYYEPWCQRAQITEDGWLWTGDLGVVDGEGYVFIRGRSKEMISIGGMKFFPQEVEVVLREHPLVQDAQVYGEPHARMGEQAAAQVVARPGATLTEAELQAYCSARLAAFKVPVRIDFVDKLSTTASGKVLRRAGAVSTQSTGARS